MLRLSSPPPHLSTNRREPTRQVPCDARGFGSSFALRCFLLLWLLPWYVWFAMPPSIAMCFSTSSAGANSSWGDGLRNHVYVSVRSDRLGGRKARADSNTQWQHIDAQGHINKVKRAYQCRVRRERSTSERPEPRDRIAMTRTRTTLRIPT